jgi:hypothetical protein
MERDLAVVKEVREAGHELVRQMCEFFARERTVLSEIVLAPMIIFSRIVRTHDAIQLLVNEEFYTEAAVLILTQFELRLDIAYTASEIKRATKWLSHEDKKWQVISISNKIKTLFTDEGERTKLNEIAGHLHGIKHGNPIYSELGFPVRRDGRKLTTSTGEITDGFSKEFGKIVSAYAVYQLGWSSHVLNVCTAKYARIDLNVRQHVGEFARALHSVEEEFRLFLDGVVTRGNGAFGMKRFKQDKT